MLGAPPDILCADQKCAKSQQSPLRFHRTPQQADLFIVTSWGTSNFPPKSRRPEILASQEHTVCLVPHHISKPRNAGLCGFWGLEKLENLTCRFRRNVHKTSTLIFFFGFSDAAMQMLTAS